MSAHRWIVFLACFTLFIQAALETSAGQEIEPMKSDVGSCYPFLKSLADHSPLSLSLLTCPWGDLEKWRTEGRARMFELLEYNPPPVPFEAVVLESRQKDGYTRQLVRYAVAPGRWTEAFLLIPDGLKGPAPAVIALHDHGGYYYYGKEKITETEISTPSLQEHIAESYQGQCFADQLVRRGYVVLVPDCFYFGSQRLAPDEVAAPFPDSLKGLTPGEDAFIREFNAFASRHESLMAKTFFMSGTTWPGVMFQDDRASLSYLLSRSEVDPERVGCMGLSIGGFRSAHLFGLDSRIKAGVVAGWMTTYADLLFDHLRNHTWMLYIPRQYAFLDLPDVVGLNAPQPLLVVNCSKDQLFTLDGMRAAEKKIQDIYTHFGAPDRFRCNFYDVPHCLNQQMQQDAFEWLDTNLKNSR
ncbi:MAG: dienelactone hydrolase family protein [Candidatus Omnitrophica bacterium]|nr:dienelactone hydrolase family protein [Candidatus Omnitrophota bacterium]MCE7907801.1 hypothetical protein [Candidatus Omnitrophica bacterium COP1]MCL4735505.1 dienelactone hydrolase family protein [Candidatus Omnitrophota bacterium]